MQTAVIIFGLIQKKNIAFQEQHFLFRGNIELKDETTSKTFFVSVYIL